MFMYLPLLTPCHGLGSYINRSYLKGSMKKRTTSHECRVKDAPLFRKYCRESASQLLRHITTPSMSHLLLSLLLFNFTVTILIVITLSLLPTLSGVT